MTSSRQPGDAVPRGTGNTGHRHDATPAIRQTGPPGNRGDATPGNRQYDNSKARSPTQGAGFFCYHHADSTAPRSIASIALAEICQRPFGSLRQPGRSPRFAQAMTARVLAPGMIAAASPGVYQSVPLSCNRFYNVIPILLAHHPGDVECH